MRRIVRKAVRKVVGKFKKTIDSPTYCNDIIQLQEDTIVFSSVK